MEYTYKDKTYKSKDNKLKVMRIVFPILQEYRKLLFNELKEVDRGLIIKYERDIAILERDIQRGEERKEDTAKLKVKYLDLKEQFETDSLAMDIKNRVAEIHNDVMLQLTFNQELMSKTIKELVEGDYSVFDYEDDNFYLFAGKVLNDFFLSMKQNNNT
jgi:predicted GNAT superfamily acetyltransferase